MSAVIKLEHWVFRQFTDKITAGCDYLVSTWSGKKEGSGDNFEDIEEKLQVLDEKFTQRLPQTVKLENQCFNALEGC